MQTATSTRRTGALESSRRAGLSNVWVRFGLAIAGLALAFGAALFSTVSRESGHLWATLALASIALMLATIVGITTVPYLASRVAIARVREALDYEVTRVGIAYVVAIVVLGAAALNTGNNLLYIVVAAMLAAILVSGFASAMALRGLQLHARLPEHVFAGRTVNGKLILLNPRRWPAFSIQVLPLAEKLRKQWKWTPATIGFPPRREASRQWITLPDRKLQRISEDGKTKFVLETGAYFPYLPGRSELSADVELHFARRGRYRQESFGLSTRFPFALFRKTRRIALVKEIIVFPAVEPTNQFFDLLPLITGEFASFVRGRGHDLYRIREYTQADSARHVDWKATAKSGSLKVREFTREDERKLRIVFDNPAPGEVAAERYEVAVALAASFSWHFSQQNAELSFAARGLAAESDVYRFLEFLACVEPAAQPTALDGVVLPEHYNLVITARPRWKVPTNLWSSSYFVFVGSER